MNKYSEVSKMITEWKNRGLSKTEIVVKSAEACMGWPYIWGAAGQQCTPSTRRSYAKRDSCPDDEKKEILRLCQVTNGKKTSCIGCKWYPDGTVLAFDCRGFTRWILGRVGISLTGAGATSQYNTVSNWTQRGEIRNMPETVCCVFMYNKEKNNYSHTGLYVGGGRIIHCSGEVKEGKIKDKGWTHYAIPKGLEGGVPVWRPTIRKGSNGEDVKYCQELLQALDYDIGSSGADGKFGTKTKEAVMAFQRDHGLSADGVVGPLTWDSLEAAKPDGSLYTVTVPHLPYYKAEALKNQYSGSTMVKEVEE